MNRFYCASFVVISAAAVFNGCGGDTTAKGTNTVTPTAAAAGHEEKIKEALVKAGIKNDAAAIFEDGEKYWTVVIKPDGVGPDGKPPLGRPIPMRVRVSKKDYSVDKSIGDPNSERPGGKGKGAGSTEDGRIVK